jgi:type II secretory ATPase GspE/PulE/Tfp pilus assembly ATPase PilB-like protein
VAAPIRIGDILKAKGIVNDKQLDIAFIQHKITGDLIGDVFVKLGFVSSKEKGQILAEQSGIEFVDLDEYAISEDALRLIPKDVALKNEFLPLDMEEGKMSIGITEPGNIMAIDTVTRMTKKQAKIYIVDRDTYYDTIEKAYYFLENPIYQQMDKITKNVQATGNPSGNDLVSMTDMAMMDGIRKNATDVHLTPTADVTHVFYRIDGVLQFGHCLPKSMHIGIISRIKILSHLDIAETRLPQDGSFTFTFLNKGYDIRVSTIPTIYGENVVMRVLSGKGTLLRMETLGFDADETVRIRKLFRKPFGVILITGPTGSGKTTTLYSALREIDLLERNVVTVEDPVEYKLSFVRQTQVLEKAGYDFALAGRNFMRQDPDVILLGEIRDEETAKIAIRASITGHLVITTLHTNDAVTSIPRLIDLNVDKYLMSSSLLAIISQRLVRKICKYCKAEYQFNDEELALFHEYGMDDVKMGFKGVGCQKCNGTGYTGRTIIGEVLVIDDEIKELIYAGASAPAIKEKAIQKGMRPLKHHAMLKAAQGITTVDEVLRVAG